MFSISDTFHKDSDSSNRRLYLFMFLIAVGFSVAFLINIKIWLMIIGICGIFLLFLNPFIFFLVFIFLISFEGIPGLEDFSYAKLMALILIAYLFLRLIVNREKIDFNDSFYIYFALFFLGGIASTFVAVDLSTSFSTLITYVSLAVLYFVARYFLSNIDRFNKTITILIVSTLITYSIAQFISEPVDSFKTWRMSSGGWDPNEFASFILVLIPLAIYRVLYSFGKAKYKYYIFIFVMIVLLIYTGSRGGMLGFLAMASVLVFYYGGRRIKQVFILLTASSLMLYYFSPEEFWNRAYSILHPETESGSSISARLVMWGIAVKMFFDHPLIGVGIYNFQYVARVYGSPWDLVSHNTYLEVLTGGGLITFIPFGLIFVDCARKLVVRRYYSREMKDLITCLKASFVSLVITSIFFSGDHEKIMWLLFAFISSAYYLALNQNTNAIQFTDHRVTDAQQTVKAGHE